MENFALFIFETLILLAYYLETNSFSPYLI